MSKLIQWQTRSPYSHVAIQLFNGKVFEAWRKGVTVSDDPFENHKDGTQIDFYDIEGLHDEEAAAEWLVEQVGKKYDYSAILRFVSRRDEPVDDKLFCSELGTTALQKSGRELFNSNLPPSHASPRDVSISPILVKSEVVA